jgi:hypothetical protein
VILKKVNNRLAIEWVEKYPLFYFLKQIHFSNLKIIIYIEIMILGLYFEKYILIKFRKYFEKN